MTNSAELEVNEVENLVRQEAPFLANGSVDDASLPYIDPANAVAASTDAGAAGAAAQPQTAVAIAPENVSLLTKSDSTDDNGIQDKVLTVEEGASLRKMLIDEGADPETAAAIQSALVANFSFDFRAGQKLRIGLAPDPDSGAIRPVRVSLYQPNDAHIATVALSDNGAYVAAQEPSGADVLDVPEQEQADQGSTLPTLYDGLWGTALTLGMQDDVVKDLIHVFSYDVDYQSRLTPSDSLDVIYAADAKPDQPEILYAALTLAGTVHKFYRFRDPADDSIDYYDEDGKSAKKFLIRKPVAGARFSSGFGMRRHPILHVYRMHTGVDWAAPVGTPIMAAGDGTIEKIGTRAGYGRSITLQHLYGYETTYNHMSGYAKGLSVGDHVTQNQVIGFVGSSGLSTGPHLHFEVLVNSRFVDPMKIRVPRGRELQGSDLVAFEQERNRVDDLVAKDEEHFASAN